MKRVIILMMDSFGIGGAKDAVAFGDDGANTLYNIAKVNNGLEIPNLNALGLGKAAFLSSGKKPYITGDSSIKIASKYGAMQEISKGKDTSSGHWEMAGVPVLFDWGYFPKEYPSFNDQLIASIVKESGINGILGNVAASGTAIIEEFGEEHIKTLKPIFYTSADSVMQIAAHEKYFGLDNLYKLCEIAFEKVKPYNIARIIARPFEGEKKGEFKRTKNRHDYSVTPPAPTVLDKLKQSGGEVVSVGKISDIYAGSGITKAVKASGLEELWDVTLNEVKLAKSNTIVFTNFVDFDMTWGHRRDVKGYAQGLEYFDKRLPELVELLQDDDIVFITADHGCDPTYKGTDHTRENVPVLMFGKNITKGELGIRKTYADIGQTIAGYFNLESMNYGKSLL
jgi:phosphopentomutase